MPMFHPSYLLRNPQKTPGSPKALTWDDIREVRRVVDELGLLDENTRDDAVVASDAEANAQSETRDETTRENERLERMNDSRRDDSRRVNDSRE